MGFIKKIMKLLQRGYDEIQSLEVELRILEETSAPPSRPRKYMNMVVFLFLLFVSLLSFPLSCGILLRVFLARDGYIIYCYGDCNRKFEEALLAQKQTGDGDDLMKAIWLDIYNEGALTRK